VLKVGAGYEKFGLGGKWLLHGTSLAKFGRTGNPIVMQRSHIQIKYIFFVQVGELCSALCITAPFGLLLGGHNNHYGAATTL
jgi:hypothetical protein